MKKYNLEIENDIEYVVIHINKDEISEWKKMVKENFEFLKKSNFKFILDEDPSMIFYTKKYQLHNLKGNAIIHSKLSDWINLYIDGVKYDTEEEYINQIKEMSNVFNGNEKIQFIKQMMAEIPSGQKLDQIVAEKMNSVEAMKKLVYKSIKKCMDIKYEEIDNAINNAPVEEYELIINYLLPSENVENKEKKN